MVAKENKVLSPVVGVCIFITPFIRHGKINLQRRWTRFGRIQSGYETPSGTDGKDQFAPSYKTPARVGRTFFSGLQFSADASELRRPGSDFLYGRRWNKAQSRHDDGQARHGRHRPGCHERQRRDLLRSGTAVLP